MKVIGYRLPALALLLLAVISGCSPEGTYQNALETAVAATIEANNTTAAAPVEAQETPIIITSTPRPTREPGVVDGAVSTVAKVTNLDQVIFLGLTGEDWINLLISAVAVLLGYLIATLVFRRFLRWLVRRTNTKFDDAFLETIQGPLHFFVLVIFVQIAVLRLTFLDENLVRLLYNVFFLLYLTTLFWIVWRLIGFSIRWYEQHMKPASEEQAIRIKKTLPLVRRLLYAVWIIFAFTMALSFWNINITAILAIIGIGGLALSLAAQDTLNDFINGILIWLDRPFRIGDRIEIQGEETWGDVTDIGTRTTRIRTRANVMVIVPNSVIGKNQVINYTYPDPTYRTEVEFHLDYSEDLDKVRRIVVEAVRSVDGVLHNQPVEALFRDFGESTIVFRVRWWINSYNDTYILSDTVNSAILNALRKAGIEIAIPRQELRGQFGALSGRSGE